MYTRAIAAILCCSFLVPTIATAQPKIVTAKQVNGTWKSKFGSFKVWALGNQKLQVEFNGTYPYKLADGSPMANLGIGNGIANISEQTAIFKPESAEDGCAISMKFSNGLLNVKQQGTCGFGHNVSAAGTYRKVSGAKPKFNENAL